MGFLRNYWFPSWKVGIISINLEHMEELFLGNMLKIGIISINLEHTEELFLEGETGNNSSFLGGFVWGV